MKFDLEDAMERRGMKPEVRARIRRLNPRYIGAGRIRGYRERETLSLMHCSIDVMGKREFITKYGRAAWDKLLPDEMFRSGKRRYVYREAVLDNVWMAKGR